MKINSVCGFINLTPLILLAYILKFHLYKTTDLQLIIIIIIIIIIASSPISQVELTKLNLIQKNHKLLLLNKLYVTLISWHLQKQVGLSVYFPLEKA